MKNNRLISLFIVCAMLFSGCGLRDNSETEPSTNETENNIIETESKSVDLTERDKERIAIVEGKNQRKIEEKDYPYTLELFGRVDKWIDEDLLQLANCYNELCNMEDTFPFDDSEQSDKVDTFTHDLGYLAADMHRIMIKAIIINKRLEAIGVESIINFDDLEKRLEEAYAIADTPLAELPDESIDRLYDLITVINSSGLLSIEIDDTIVLDGSDTVPLFNYTELPEDSIFINLIPTDKIDGIYEIFGLDEETE